MPVSITTVSIGLLSLLILLLILAKTPRHGAGRIAWGIIESTRRKPTALAVG